MTDSDSNYEMNINKCPKLTAPKLENVQIENSRLRTEAKSLTSSKLQSMLAQIMGINKSFACP